MQCVASWLIGVGYGAAHVGAAPRVGIWLFALSSLSSLGACVVPADPAPESPWAVDVKPASGQTAVSVWTELVVSLDRRIWPQSLRADTLRVQSGESTPMLSLTYDPVDLEVRARARAPLLSETAYTVTMDGLVDLDGVPQPEPIRVVFATGTGGAHPPPRPSAAWREVAPILRTRCALPGCHGGGQPAFGLDLSGPQAVEATAVGVASRLHRSGPTRDTVPRGHHTLAGLPIIDRLGMNGQAGTSYLLYKLVGDPHVLGERMPAGAPPLAPEELGLLRDWIASGASTSLDESE